MMAARALVFVAAIAAACGPVAGDPPSDIPVNACPDFPCDAYRPLTSGGAAPQCKQGVCQVTAKLDFTLVVTPPDSSYFAPGMSFVLPAANLFEHPSDKCPSGQCTQLPVLGIVEGDYLIDPVIWQRSPNNPNAIPYYLGESGVVMPSRVTYRPLSGAFEASRLGLPVDVIAARSVVLPGAAAGPGGGPNVGFRVILPPGSYERTVAPEPPFDAFFPPHVSVVDVKSGLTFDPDELRALDAPVQAVSLRREDGASLDGWLAYARDATTLRRISNAAVLGAAMQMSSSPPTYRFQVSLNRHADPLTNMQAVVDSPPGVTAAPSLVVDVLGQSLEAPPYPKLPPPATVRGFVASTLGNAPVAADLRFVSTKIYFDPASKVMGQTTLTYEATATALPSASGQPARYSVILPRGEYQVIVSPRDPQYAKRVLPQTFIVDAVNDPQDGKNLTVSRKRVVRGTALVSDGRPLAHAEVTATPAAALFAPAPSPSGPQPIPRSLAPRPAQTTTDARGIFTLELDPGSYDVTVKPAQGSKLPWVVSPSRVVADADLTLDPVLVPAPVSAGLTILDASTPPNPMVGAMVRAFAVPTGGTAYVEIGRAITDSKGHYEMFLAGTPH